MTGPCNNCGTDPGFDWAICPKCGFRAGQSSGPAPSAGGDRWDPTVVEGTAAGRPRERARFGNAGDFYQPVNGPSAPAGLRFQAESDSDRTVMDRGFDRASSADAGDDRTIIDRGGRGIPEEEAGDSTVIIRGGRKGIKGPLVYLVQRNGIRAGRVHLLSEETAIGRESDQDIVLSDETVSKRHAKIRVEEGKYVFWDLASANHSYVLNGDGSKTRILEPRPLTDGDTLLLGEARLTYLEVDVVSAE